MKENFIPSREGDLTSFETNFLEKLNAHAESLSISASDLEKANNVLQSHNTSFTVMKAKKAESRSATEGNNLKRTAAIDEIRRMVKVVKGSQGYTTEIGAALGIIGSESPSINTYELQPELRSVVDGSQVVLKFKKNGADGIRLYSERGGESEFKFLAIDTSSPYTDTREKLEQGKPEQREYYAFYFEEDVETGLQSDTIKVIVP